MRNLKIVFVFFALAALSGLFGGCRSASVPEEAFPSKSAGVAEVFMTSDGERFRAAYPRTRPARLLLLAWEETLGNVGRETDAAFAGNPVFAAGTLRAGFSETQTFFRVKTAETERVFVREAVVEDKIFREFLAELPFVPAENP